MECIKLQFDLWSKTQQSYNNFRKSPKVRITVPYINTRTEVVKEYWSRFVVNHDKIVTDADEDDTCKEKYFVDNLYSTVEELYLDYCTELNEALEKLKEESSSSASTRTVVPVANTQERNNNVKLPNIVIPFFQGNYAEWPTFHDMFESLIHNNSALAPVQKLHYLKGHLKGEAEQLLRNINITDANQFQYAECWSILKKRYDNKRYVANCILTRLCNQKPVTKESSSAIKQIFDTTTECLNALKNIGVETNNWDAIIIHLISQKLDHETRKLWEQQNCSNYDELPKYSSFKTFLESRFRMLEFVPPPQESKDLKPKRSNAETPNVFTVTTNTNCIFCTNNHFLGNCKEFSKESVENRRKFVQGNKLCFNCLGASHAVFKCRLSKSCRRCGRRHHSLLHLDYNPNQRVNGPISSIEDQVDSSIHKHSEDNKSPSTQISSHFARGSPDQVLLSTALVRSETSQGCYTLRALLDQGSQASFITEFAVQLLGLRKKSVRGTVSGLGGSEINLTIKHMVSFNIQSTHSSYTIEVKAYVLGTLSSKLPTHKFSIQGWPEFKDLKPLADPGYDTPNKIDLLLGADIYGQILTDGLIKGPPGTLTAQNTSLGWILSGVLQPSNHCTNIFSMHILDNSLNELLRKFWEVETEEEHSKKRLSGEELKCEEFYNKTTTRDKEGRYVVQLPFRDGDPSCKYGKSRDIALRRFYALERKLERDPNLKQKYTEVIKNYLQLNHMEPVKKENEKSVYLPHHAVVRDDKSTTRVRVVFDASCKGENGVSLNDDLMIGPGLQPELRHLIMTFRTYPVCFVADVVKMYRQVKVKDSDADFQRIIWRDDPSKDISDYRITRVTFGTASAPYLAIKSLLQVAKDEGERYPLAAERVLKDFYVDDLMSGCEEEDDVIEIYNQITELLRKGGFELQKWSSNSEKLTGVLEDHKRKEKSLDLGSDEIVKLLGLSWKIKEDKFKYKVNLPPMKPQCTKRNVLSDIARLFDPLGWIAPVVVKAKIFMQRLWLVCISWDNELPEGLYDEWIAFREQLLQLNEFVIPRWLNIRKGDVSVELHGFSDASNVAYAAVIYARVIDRDGKIHVNLITARTKVAPIKQVSIPRLELCGAQLTAKLLAEVSTVMMIPRSNLRAWTDSTIVLAWLSGQPNRWKPFVANRVSEIISILDNDQWAHVDSHQNPADCASRGLDPGELQSNTLWLKGPQWLHKALYSTPSNFKSTTLELKQMKTHLATSTEELHIWTKYSSLKKLTRIIAWCRRWLLIVRSKSNGQLYPSYLFVNELDAALKICIKFCQAASFSSELRQLSQNGTVSNKSSLLSLSPFTDKDNIMRVRGRLQQSDENYDVKHPIILAPDCHISKLIVADAHERTLHGGPQLVLNCLRSRYWIIRVKPLINQHIKKCVRCAKYAAASIQPFMGQLPPSRVKPSRPFSRSGVDYAGPISLRISKGRGCRSYKGYICLFICMATKAIHLEAVSDMTTEGFLAAFKRFVARRGHCQEIWSDNGTNFVGASNELSKLFSEEQSSISKEIAQHLAINGTEWHFIPPHAPNFGGLWEAGVKSTKFHLRRILDGSTLTFEEMITVLAQVEACLNSRPISQLSSHDNVEPLTPGHFLVGEPLVIVPDHRCPWRRAGEAFDCWAGGAISTVQLRYTTATIACDYRSMIIQLRNASIRHPKNLILEDSSGTILVIRKSWAVNVGVDISGTQGARDITKVGGRKLNAVEKSKENGEKIVFYCDPIVNVRNKTPRHGSNFIVQDFKCKRSNDNVILQKNFMRCYSAKPKRKAKTQHSFKRKRLKRSPLDSRPELVYTFIEQAVQPGAQVALKCSAVGEPPPRFRWTLDGQPLPSHHGATISEGRENGPSGIGGGSGYILSTLSVISARVEHGGRYECRAINSHGSVAHAARLNVYGPPYIRSMNSVKAVAGSEVTLWCPYYGFPVDSVKWEGGAGSDIRYQQVDGQLRITNVDRDRDQGSWVCSVLTPGGELARREVQVAVVSPPVLSPIIPPPGLRAGERTQLTCTVTSGDMPVYFSWLKDQMPVSSALQVEERSAEFFSMLLFKSLTDGHSGTYTCVVTNTAGKANTSAELAIKVPPYWQSEPADVAVLLGGALTVSCEAKGHPTPTIYWTKFTGTSESSLGGVSDLLILGNGSLRLDLSKAEHSGKYRCRADNGVAPGLSKTFNIHVNEPARFETQSVNVTSRLGDTVRLACVARGDSPLSTAWSHSGRALPNSDYRMSISETRSAEGLRSELVIERADRRDSGLYRCQATNPFGRSDHFIHLAVQEPPEPPANFHVIETTSRSIKLQWRRPYDGNSPVLGYSIQYRKHEAAASDSWRDAETQNVTASAHSDSYTEGEVATITGLEPATAYLVRAQTMTGQFSSSHTRALLALTLHEPPSRVPLSLRATAPRPSTIEFNWQSPPSSSWNGELLGYTVFWWAAADGSMGTTSGVGMEFATVRGQVSKYTIEGLEHYTRYSVTVRAFNSAGAGPATVPVNILTQESVPSEGPRALRCRAVSPQSLKVEWSPPPANVHHGALLGYKLLYRPKHTTEWLEWEVRGVSSPGSGTGAEVKRVAGVETLLLALKPHTNYTVQALAYTAAGDGVPAVPIHCTTQQDVPGPPAAVKVVATSSTSLVVSWLPPSRPNGPVMHYTIFYRELGRERPPRTTIMQAEKIDAAVGLGGSAELRSLSEGSAYEAWVSAHSAAGEGEPSSPQPATTSSRAGARLLSFGVWARVSCGHSLKLTCVWRGEPPPRVRWLRGDRPVTHDPRTHLTPQGHLAIHEVDGTTSGNYTCSARNSFGSEEVTYRVECAAPPSAPQMTLEHAAHHEARLTWRTNHHPSAPPHGFTIWWMRVRDESGEGIESSNARVEEERRLEAGGEAVSVVLRVLSCGATYSVRAMAHSRAGPSPASVPILVRTKPPVLVWEGGGNNDEGSEAAVWSNSSSLAVDARRAVRCGARLVRMQWRRADAAASVAWRDADLTALHHQHEVMISGLSPGAWYAMKLWTATESIRHQSVIYAATTTHSGERLRRPVAFQSESSLTPAVTNTSADTEKVLGAVSLAFAAVAGVAVAALLFVLLARRSTFWPCGSHSEEEVRRCSHSVASTDKSVCPEQQNLRNCQHDYKHDKLSPASDVYEISPYATFAVGAEGAAATLDHTLQFRTFGHRENDAPPHRPCRKHPQRHRERAEVEKHHSDCELQQLSRYEKVRPRHCSGTSYCVPLAHHGFSVVPKGGGSAGGSGFSEVYAGDSSADSGPGSLSPRAHHEHS